MTQTCSSFSQAYKRTSKDAQLKAQLLSSYGAIGSTERDDTRVPFGAHPFRTCQHKHQNRQKLEQPQGDHWITESSGKPWQSHPKMVELEDLAHLPERALNSFEAVHPACFCC
jgi:hypothetical protein